MIEEKNPYFSYIALPLVLLFLLFSVGLFLLPKKTFSEDENRYLQKFPELTMENLLDTSFMSKLENYTGDHFPLRKPFLDAKTRMELALGKDENNEVYYGKNQNLIEKYRPMTENEIEKFASVLNQFQKKNPDIPMMLLLVPTAISIDKENLPAFVTSDSQEKDRQSLYQKTREFQPIDVKDALEEGKKSHPLFYRLDHHWTTYGAFYAYRAFCEQTKKDTPTMADFTTTSVSTTFRGTLYSKANVYFLKDDEIVQMDRKEKDSYTIRNVTQNQMSSTFYFEDHLSTKDQYAYFLDGNQPLLEITNHQNPNGKHLLLLKDSYANSFIPFISHDYEKVTVIDPRYYKYSVSDYIKQHHIDEVLFLYNMNTLQDDIGLLALS